MIRIALFECVFGDHAGGVRALERLGAPNADGEFIGDVPDDRTANYV